MSNVPQHLIDEATRRGIVPGAIVACATTPSKSLAAQGVVLPFDQWNWDEEVDNPLVYAGRDNQGASLFFAYNGKWASVITPAPQAEGLKECDAVECGPAMRVAIIELAKELGISMNMLGYPALTWAYNSLQDCRASSDPDTIAERWHTPEAFIAKMRVMAAQPKPIKIGDRTVEFRSGSIRVGCTTTDNTTVRSIAEKINH